VSRVCEQAPETKYLQSLNENDFAVTKKAVSEVVANLDTLSRRLIPSVESFVVLAPAVASRGAKAKSNYVFANADVFRISEVRKISSYPAVSILLPIAIFFRHRFDIIFLKNYFYVLRTLRCCFQVVIEYGAIDGCSDTFNSPNFKPASIVSALSILDEVTKQSQNPTVVSYTKFNGPNYDDSDVATPLLLTIAKIFGNILGNISRALNSN